MITQEKEISFEETFKFTTSTAEKSITSQEAPLTEEVTTEEEDVTKLRIDIPEQEQALQEHIPHTTVSITKITSTEKESDCKPGNKPTTFSAEMELEATRKTSSTAQVLTQEKKIIFEEAVKCKTSKADKTISPQKAPLIEEVTTSEDTGKLTAEVPDTVEAQREHIPHTAVSITETTSTEKETDYKPAKESSFEGTVTFKTSNADKKKTEILERKTRKAKSYIDFKCR